MVWDCAFAMTGKPRPTQKLRDLIAVLGTRKTALEWGLEPGVLSRFLGGGGITLSTAGRIISKTGQPYDALFEL